MPQSIAPTKAALFKHYLDLTHSFLELSNQLYNSYGHLFTLQHTQMLETTYGVSLVLKRDEGSPTKEVFVVTLVCTPHQSMSYQCLLDNVPLFSATIKLVDAKEDTVADWLGECFDKIPELLDSETNAMPVVYVENHGEEIHQISDVSFAGTVDQYMLSLNNGEKQRFYVPVDTAPLLKAGDYFHRKGDGTNEYISKELIQ